MGVHNHKCQKIVNTGLYMSLTNSVTGISLGNSYKSDIEESDYTSEELTNTV